MLKVSNWSVENRCQELALEPMVVRGEEWRKAPKAERPYFLPPVPEKQGALFIFHAHQVSAQTSSDRPKD
jgi:hypothetical protein